MDLHKAGVLAGFVLVLCGVAFRRDRVTFAGGLVQFVAVWSQWV